MPIGNWVVVGGTAPPPHTRFDAEFEFTGKVRFTNSITGVTFSPLVLDGINNQIGTLTNTGAGMFQAYIASQNILYPTYFKTNQNSPFAIVSDGSIAATNGFITATNFVWSSPRWVDALASGFAIGNNASFDPPAFSTNGWEYSQSDKAFFVIQSPHVMASTNSTFPNFYYEPHIHVTAAAAVTNQWRIGYQVATVFGSYSNYTTLTNTVIVSNANHHALLSFGNITNNLLQAKSSVIFKGYVQRLDAVAIPVILDSIDFHVPVRVFGSATQTSDE
jgi:hypothetical protein